MHILLVEPFYGGSHRQWIDGLIKSSIHSYSLLTLSAHHWKWRMHGGAVTLANQLLKSDTKFDLVIASDMLDLPTFMALTRERLAGVPIAIYFHENQITYPWNELDQDVVRKRDNHYGFINYVSALAADVCLFNSDYHKNSFLRALPSFLKQFPDQQNTFSISQIEEKSSTLHLGLDLKSLDSTPVPEKPDEAVLLWNHRWEYDKNPDLFFASLFQLKSELVPFKLIVLGQELKQSPPIFRQAIEMLKDNIIHWGFCENREEYASLLQLADFIPVTSNQDFFGGSIVEAAYCNTIPLLPERLAYPEHFQAYGNRSEIFYQNDKDFPKALKTMIDRLDYWRTQSLRPHIENYDWSILRPKYDQIFAELRACLDFKNLPAK